MNVILIVSDTLRRDYLPCYGNNLVHAPALDAFARDAVVLDRAYAGSFPTLPNRAELFTGRYVFPWLQWGPLPANEPVVAELLAEAGYQCVMVTDNNHLFRYRHAYNRGFQASLLTGTQFQATRNQRWNHAEYQEFRAKRKTEEDWSPAVVTQEAIHWLECHARRRPFFMLLDYFDPHEPWDPPEELVDLYLPGADEQLVRLGFNPAGCTSDELKAARALYSAEITLVDRALGRLFSALDALDLRDDTAVLFYSDHGIMLGERGLVGKSWRHQDSLYGFPLYPEIARVPMMMRVPGCAPGRSDTLAMPGDLSRTLLDLAGVPAHPRMDAVSLMPVLKDPQCSVREFAVSSWSLGSVSPYRPSAIRTREWSLHFWLSGLRPRLYHLPTDPGERRDVARQHPGVCRSMHALYVRFLQQHDVPTRHLLPRRWVCLWSDHAARMVHRLVTRTSGQDGLTLAESELISG
jgi:arylsulfatase A-like enzyme